MLDRFESGSGPLVVLCHGAASHSGQWRSLIERLAPRYKVVAFDQYGYRESPKWHQDYPMTYSDQAEPILDYINHEQGSVQDKIHLVGHSHGASIVTTIALALGRRVTSLSIYEPNSFGVLADEIRLVRQYNEIVRLFGDLEDRLENVESQEAFAKDLIHFWLGEGSWIRLPARQRAQLVELMPQTVHEVHAALFCPFSIEPLKEIADRVMLMYDPSSPPHARAVSEYYEKVLAHSRVERFQGCGHLAPITHSDLVNAAIADHIEQTNTH